MAGSRSSSRIAAKQASSPDKPSPARSSGTKRKAAAASSSSPGKGAKKRQTKLEEALPGGSKPSEDQGSAEKEVDKPGRKKATSQGKPDQKKSNGLPHGQDGGGVEPDPERKDKMPSNISERGIIYFFARGRVDVDEPNSVNDIARSYLVLRPLPFDKKIGEGPIDDLKNNRLIALPKKTLPKSHKDVFMAFVEKAKASVKDLKEDFLKGSDYETKTQGTRHSPAATPIGEGVYSITALDRNSRLAYMLTLPDKLGEVQKAMGIADKGSFVISIKNPDQKGPPQASLPQGPDYPKDMRDEFQGRRWLGTVQPKHLDYANAQLLLIGEGFGDISKATRPTEEDEKSKDKETPAEEMEKLEDEDMQRVEALDGDHAIYLDLGASKKDYPALKTTW